MSLTLIAWLFIFLILTYKAIFQRAVWGFSVYCLTFFACPPFWWWGRPIGGYSWSMIGGCILLAGYISDYYRQGNESTSFVANDQPEAHNLKTKWPAFRLPRFNLYLILMAVNCTIVHYILAEYKVISFDHYLLTLKVIFLTFLIKQVIKTHDDLKIVLMTLMLGMGYIGYEVTINEAGHMAGGRLESVGAPGARTSNFLACLTAGLLPVSGFLILTAKNIYVRLAALACTPFTFNVLLLCNSRGAFLAILGAGIFLLFTARRKEWKLICIAVILAIVGVVTLVEDQKITNRFYSTFASEEERDNSANTRLILWQAGLKMVSDYPLGAGGSSFKRIYGHNYFAQYGITENIRAIHNGFITDATEWGIQWVFIKLFFILNIFFCISKANKIVLIEHGNYKVSLLGKSLFAGIVAVLIATMFGDTFDAEWLFWLMAIAYSYCKLVSSGSYSKSALGF